MAEVPTSVPESTIPASTTAASAQTTALITTAAAPLPSASVAATEPPITMAPPTPPPLTTAGITTLPSDTVSAPATISHTSPASSPGVIDEVPPALSPPDSTVHVPPPAGLPDTSVAAGSVLADISWTSVPADVIRPTTDATIDSVTNPINGRRGGPRPRAEELACLSGAPEFCLTRVLDTLGFDVTSGTEEQRERSTQRATAVVQLDAGLEVTGVADAQLISYLGNRSIAEHSRVDEVRRIGTSEEGREIMAMRVGNGPRTVMVVGQTHGDEEGGLRVLLRALSEPIPDAVTLWIVPTMNPDGSVADTRFLANGLDPNRRAPEQIEQRAVYDFAIAVQPTLTIWYHQNYGWVGASGASVLPAKLYQELSGLGNLRRSGDCAKGFMWCPIDDAVGSSSILVELPDVLTPAEVQAHAAALLAVAEGDP